MLSPKKILEMFMARDDLGRWVPGTSGNVGGRPKPPDGLRARLAQLSPRAVERLGELLDSGDERVRLEAAKAILDRHLGRPANPGRLSLTALKRRSIAALLETISPSAMEPIMLEDGEEEIFTTPPSRHDPLPDELSAVSRQVKATDGFGCYYRQNV